jgi:glyoxylase-like metal-dependent hydrolase (beta-lactamase superfamily II)
MTGPYEVCQGVYLVGDSDLSDAYDCCVYLLDAGDLVLIDSGAGRSFDRIVSNIRTLGFDPAHINTVLATHAHIDHIGSLHQFREEFGARIAAHELDAAAIEDGKGTAAEAYGVSYTPCRVDLKLHGSGETLRFARCDLNVVHIPGHTPGSIAAYADVGEKRVLFGQDVHGPYLPHWGADPVQARESLRKLIDLKADVLCEGHFGTYEPAVEVERYIRGYLLSL